MSKTELKNIILSKQQQQRNQAKPRATTAARVYKQLDSMSCTNAIPSANKTTTITTVSYMAKAGKITVYKSQRGRDQLCLDGFMYQIEKKLKSELKWSCKEKRSQYQCSSTIKTTTNQSVKENPVYHFVSAGPFPHQHAPDEDQQVVSQLTAQLKMEAEKARTIPASKLRNDTCLTPVCQRLRQRETVAATTTVTANVSSGNCAAAKSSKGAKKANNTKRKHEDSDDDDSNGRLK